MPPSKQVVDREKSANLVVASVTTNAATTHSALDELLSPHLADGETLPDVGLLLTLFGRALGAASGALTAADGTYAAELADDDAFRIERDEATAALSSTTTRMREALDGVYGGAAMNAYGIRGLTPRDPAPLKAFASQVADLLETKELPPPALADVRLDRAALAASLRQRIAPVEAALGHVDREIREAQATRVERDRAMDANDHAFQRTASAIAALYRLAGEDELAGQVRPSGRRPGRVAAPSEADDPTDESEAAKTG
jgi:hypothetical protein